MCIRDRPKGEGNEASPGYLVTIKFDRDGLSSLEQNHNVELYPGMLTEVLIIGEERTLWDYLVSPLVSGMQKAMREV